MIKTLAVLVSVIGVAGCATSPSPTAGCTNLISGSGGMLKFCQTNNVIAITETGVDGTRGNRPRIVDDVRTLAALERQLHLNNNLRKSRAIVKRACVVNGTSYINISVSDAARLMDTGK